MELFPVNCVKDLDKVKKKRIEKIVERKHLSISFVNFVKKPLLWGIV